MSYNFVKYDTIKDIDGSGTVTIWTPTTGYRAVVGYIAFTVDADATVTMYWGTDSATNRIVNLDLKAGQGICVELGRVIEGAANAVLKITATAGNVAGTVMGWEQ